MPQCMTQVGLNAEPVAMRFNTTLIAVMGVISLSGIAAGAAMSAHDRYSLKVPGGLAFAEFRGFEGWQLISVSHNGERYAAILGNPAMIAAFKAGIPQNGKPFPDGAKMAKIHWEPKQQVREPGQPIVPGTLHDVDFMVKDSRKFSDSGGWGYAEFEYDVASGAYRPGTTADSPPQANDAKCGFACHTVVRARDYVFTEYAPR
jgi:hypothetical protein